MKNARVIVISLSLLICFCGGCATVPPPQPIAYLAVEKPNGIIKTTENISVRKEFPRGGFYIGAYNFRPAPDIASYINQTARETNTDILRNADVQLVVPFYFDLFLCGYGKGTDSVISGK